MNTVIVLRILADAKHADSTPYIAYVPQSSQPDSQDWVFGGRVKTQDEPLITAWLLLDHLAAQISRRLETQEMQLGFDLT